LVEVDAGEVVFDPVKKTYAKVSHWLEISEYFASPDYATAVAAGNKADIFYFTSMLDLFEKLTLGNNQLTVQYVTRPHKNRLGGDEPAFLHPSEVLACMANEELPDSLRARYTALLFLFVDDGSLPTKDDIGVKQTWLWKQDITKDYVASFSLDATGLEEKKAIEVIIFFFVLEYSLFFHFNFYDYLKLFFFFFFFFFFLIL
jgi:hypothetical protein